MHTLSANRNGSRSCRRLREGDTCQSRGRTNAWAQEWVRGTGRTQVSKERVEIAGLLDAVMHKNRHVVSIVAGRVVGEVVG